MCECSQTSLLNLSLSVTLSVSRSLSLSRSLCLSLTLARSLSLSRLYLCILIHYINYKFLIYFYFFLSPLLSPPCPLPSSSRVSDPYLLSSVLFSPVLHHHLLSLQVVSLVVERERMTLPRVSLSPDPAGSPSPKSCCSPDTNHLRYDSCPAINSAPDASGGGEPQKPRDYYFMADGRVSLVTLTPRHSIPFT